jgi:hypothetical protein
MESKASALVFSFFLMISVMLFASISFAGGISGVVTADADGSPLKGICVEADSGAGYYSTNTGLDGSYTITGYGGSHHDNSNPVIFLSIASTINKIETVFSTFLCYFVFRLSLCAIKVRRRVCPDPGAISGTGSIDTGESNIFF